MYRKHADSELTGLSGSPGNWLTTLSCGIWGSCHQLCLHHTCCKKAVGNGLSAQNMKTFQAWGLWVDFAHQICNVGENLDLNTVRLGQRYWGTTSEKDREEPTLHWVVLSSGDGGSKGRDWKGHLKAVLCRASPYACVCDRNRSKLKMKYYQETSEVAIVKAFWLERM